jgi:16S rRNA processing protein RimM
LSAVPLSDRAERVRRAYVNGQALEIERIWRHDERLVFKFRGIDSISDAEKLADSDVCIPAEERAPLGDDEFYQSDLIGFQIIEAATGKTLGFVEDWQEYGGPPLMVVKGEKELLIPFARAICRQIDVAGKRIEVAMPEGLDDL